MSTKPKRICAGVNRARIAIVAIEVRVALDAHCPPAHVPTHSTGTTRVLRACSGTANIATVAADSVTTGGAICGGGWVVARTRGWVAVGRTGIAVRAAFGDVCTCTRSRGARIRRAYVGIITLRRKRTSTRRGVACICGAIIAITALCWIGAGACSRIAGVRGANVPIIALCHICARACAGIA